MYSTRITIHAGHNKQGKVACGASDYIDESKEARVITKKVAKKLRNMGYKVSNCTVNDGTSQNDVLRKICAKCNSKARFMDVSIHFNAAFHSKSDGNTKGVEVWVYDDSGVAAAVSKDICKNISKLGFRNRGVKVSQSLYFLRNTNAKSLLIEVCFVDDEDDAKLYLANKDKIASAIAKAIANNVPT